MTIKKLIVALLTLGSVAVLASPALSVPVEILLQTGGDDLRQGSYANFYIKLRGRPLIARNNITRRQNLANNSLTRRTIDIPELTSLNQVEYCEIEHVSQESGGQTADNWNLDSAVIRMRRPSDSALVTICERTRRHRFDGNNRRLTINRVR